LTFAALLSHVDFGRNLRSNWEGEDIVDLISWIVVGGVIVLAIVGVVLWRKFGPGLPVDRLDRDNAKIVKDAAEAAETTKKTNFYHGDSGGIS
jgi:hypothetical protein